MPAAMEGRSAAQGLGGLLVDLVTPLRPDRSLDPEGLETLLLRVGPESFEGIAPAGTAGEGPLLPLGLRCEITRLVADHVPGFNHVLPAALGTSPATVLGELDALASSGATAAMVSPLSYYPMDDSAVAGFLAEVVERSPLPVVLYNAPRLTGVQIPLALVAELAGCDTVIGINDAGGDAGYLVWLVLHAQTVPGFAVLCGDDSGLMPAIVAGASGAVTAAANLVPELVVEVFARSIVRSLHPARVAHRRLSEVVCACQSYGFPAAWKAAASAAGLCGPTPALRGYGLGADEARGLAARLAQLEAPARRP